MNVLPNEVLAYLAQFLSQEAALHLALTCSEVYHIIRPMLYQTIVVDSSKRLFNGHSDSRHLSFSHEAFPNEPTVVRSLHAFTRLCKNLVLSPLLCRYVKVLVIQDKFPDMPHLELLGYLRHIFPHLVNLSVLNWYAMDQVLDAELIGLLPNPRLLLSLCGNFSFVGSLLPAGDFKSLKHLDLSNIGCDKSLAAVDLGNFSNITSLVISKLPSQNNLLFSSSSCCKSALNSTVESISHHESPSFISTLLRAPVSLQLSSLSLKDILLCARDAHLLLKAIDFPNLHTLSVDSCLEPLFREETMSVTRRNPPAELFLDVLAVGAVNLKVLNINLTNELCYNKCAFDFIAGMSGLQKLAIHLKFLRSDREIDLLPLVKSIASHSTTLEYLKVCCDVVEPQQSVCPKKNNSYSLESITGLNKLRKLKVLKLPVAFGQVTSLPKILPRLADLRVLQLGIADLAFVVSKAACSNCDETLIHVLRNTNCLISLDYLNCPSSFTSKVENNKSQQYLEFSQQLKATFQWLHYVKFDLKNQSMLYDCGDTFNIVEKDWGMVKQFDSLVLLYA